MMGMVQISVAPVGIVAGRTDRCGMEWLGRNARKGCIGWSLAQTSGFDVAGVHVSKPTRCGLQEMIPGSGRLERGLYFTPQTLSY